MLREEANDGRQLRLGGMMLRILKINFPQTSKTKNSVLAKVEILLVATIKSLLIDTTAT